VNGISITATGLDETEAAIQGIVARIDSAKVLGDVSSTFASRLRAATPAGYSGRLRDSVLQENNESSSAVGYDKAVETAGNPRLDTVIRPATVGRSVLRWTRVGELEAVLEETLDAFAGECVSVMQDKFLEQINGRS
jgi:hypothetical protein